MEQAKTNTVVIIAAGMGTRLRSELGPPKPLLPVNGRPLILRVLDRFAEAGVENAVVVVGHRADEVIEGVESSNTGMSVRFAHNPQFTLSNGLSVLAARELVGDQPFFLSMADHIFDADLIAGLRQAAIPTDGLVLAVDRKLDEIFDMDDATKVLTDGERIVEINKELPEFDAVDTGLFACTPALFTAIETFSKQRENRDCTLSEGVKTLTARGRALVHDVGTGRWQDVDTPEAAAHAEKLFI